MSNDYKTATKPGTPGRAPSPIPGTTSAKQPMTGGPGPDFPAPGALENANAARGQRVIDEFEAARRGKK